MFPPWLGYAGVNTRSERIIRNFFKKGSGADEVRAQLPGLYPRLWRFALSLTGDRQSADDLAQATAMRAIEQADKFQAGTTLAAWLFTMMRRIWLNEKRAERIRGTGSMVSLDDIELPSNEASAEMNTFTRQVFDQVMALPEAQRTTLFLVYVEGHSYREAAEVLGIPIGTVMSRLAAARKTIQDQTDQRKARSQ